MVSQQEHELQGTDSSSGITIDERQKELAGLIEQKKTLDALYTPDHPDVVAITRRIADLKADIAYASAQPAPATKTAATKRPDPPQLQQLKAQLRAVQQSIATAKHEQQGLSSRFAHTNRGSRRAR